jgi:hypothetical protein
LWFFAFAFEKLFCVLTRHDFVVAFFINLSKIKFWNQSFLFFHSLLH